MNNQISLQNIWQFRTIDSEGNLRAVNSNNLEQGIERVLADASWNVDPQSIPPQMQDTWLAVEFGNFAAVAKGLNRSLKSKRPATKSAAEALDAFVQSQLQIRLATAATKRESGEGWSAYKAYLAIAQKFDGFEMSDIDLEEVLDELKMNKTVKTEMEAQKQLLGAHKQAAKSGFKKVIGRLRKIIEKYPQTEAAETAQRLLSTNGE